MPTDLDVYAPERWRDDALFRTEVREAYRKIVDQGLAKCQRPQCRLRIDHFLLSPPLEKKLKRSGVDRDVRGPPGASDHAPVWIELK